VTLLPQIQVSELDSKRFLINVERLSITNEDEISDGKIVDLCRAMSGDLLILRAPSSRIALGSQLLEAERLEAFQADTLVYFVKTLEDVSLPLSETPSVQIRKSVPGDKKDVGSVAREAFENYPSHYLANQRLDPTAISQGYGEWAERCVDDPFTMVLVAIVDDVVCGFIATKVDDQSAEVVLNAVHPRFQGRGIYQDLLQRTCKLVFEEGGNSISISTQISNQRVINIWTRSGFVLKETFNTFHLRPIQ
jgi:ribosomal protein S18 acetylase RimI-like enzyme